MKSAILRDYVKLMVGLTVNLFPRYKQRLLRSWARPETLFAFERVVLFPSVLDTWVHREYLATKDPDERERLKDSLMGGDTGADWAEQYQARSLDFSKTVGSMTYAEAAPLLPDLNKALMDMPPCLAIQIGSSSGREIAWIASQHPQHSFMGIDPYSSVVEVSKRYHQNPNLEFLPARATNVPLLAVDWDGPLVLFSSGSLQYVQPEHMTRVFADLSERDSTEIWLLEPVEVSSSFDPVASPGSIWRGNFSYSHNYKHYAERAGWETITCKLIRPYATSDPIHANTAHYFYVARTKSEEAE